MITTTLNKIRAHSPCKDGWDKLLKSLGKIKADDEALKFSQILESNGLDDALWCLRSICPEHDKDVRLFAADCAEAVLHIYEKKYPKDMRPRQAIEVARKFANGEISAAARSAAGSAAWSAAWSAAGSAARSAARSAAGDAAWSAAGSAARSAARSAAGDAAWSAAWSAAGDAAWSAAWSAAGSTQTKMITERFS